ncbi:hypothetical protein FDECE_6744 [Fusarium decemcellulare]|nr:hypothetical protein FDECE_6744 [Fusarium decemcellulare]
MPKLNSVLVSKLLLDIGFASALARKRFSCSHHRLRHAVTDTSRLALQLRTRSTRQAGFRCFVQAQMSPTESDSSPLWQQMAKDKQRERDALISQWSTDILGSSIPRLPDEAVKNVRDWPVRCGHLTPTQVEITASTPTKILSMIRTKAWTAEEVFVAFSVCAAIAHHLTNPFTQVFFEQGLGRARELDAHIQQTGDVVGPLHGLPFSLKDVMNLEGRTTTLGFMALADNVPQSSDELATRLRNAGAVFYCKTNVPQSLMSGECNNMLYGRTSTPDNRTLSAGGSSGGEGSLIALRGSPLGIGTDIAGSIRTPANFNGIYGLCPTYGRLPCHSAKYSTIGLINGVAGPMSSSIDGLELYTRTVLSFEPWTWDPTCQPLPWNEQEYSNTRKRAAAGELCFGFIAHDGVVRPHPPIDRGLGETKEALLRVGHDVVDVDLFHSDDKLWDTALRIFCADGGEALRKMLDVIPEPPIKELLIPPPSMALSAGELENESKTLLKIRERLLKSTMEYFLYEAISNIIDWPCATIPVGNVDPLKDPQPAPNDEFVPMSEDDCKNWEKYSPEAYENGAICLQILGPRHSEEVVLATMRAVDEALGRGPDLVL